jgi:hypothetical protein
LEVSSVSFFISMFTSVSFVSSLLMLVEEGNPSSIST